MAVQGVHEEVQEVDEEALVVHVEVLVVDVEVLVVHVEVLVVHVEALVVHVDVQGANWEDHWDGYLKEHSEEKIHVEAGHCTLGHNVGFFDQTWETLGHILDVHGGNIAFGCSIPLVLFVGNPSEEIENGLSCDGRVCLFVGTYL